MRAQKATCISDWNPEDPTFWNTKGRAIALRNLIWSIVAERRFFDQSRRREFRFEYDQHLILLSRSNEGLGARLECGRRQHRCQ